MHGSPRRCRSRCHLAPGVRGRDDPKTVARVTIFFAALTVQYLRKQLRRQATSLMQCQACYRTTGISTLPKKNFWQGATPVTFDHYRPFREDAVKAPSHDRDVDNQLSCSFPFSCNTIQQTFPLVIRCICERTDVQVKSRNDIGTGRTQIGDMHRQEWSDHPSGLLPD